MIDRLLILRTCLPSGISRNDFQWPMTVGAVVEAPDWDADPQRDCGGGLHGLPWGHGDGTLLHLSDSPRWLVVEVDLSAGCVGSGGKCRFQRGTILHVGDRASAAEVLAAHGADGGFVGQAVCAGVGGRATAGYGGHATAGDWGRATAGDWGRATVGDEGFATAGNWGFATAGDGGFATAGVGGFATAGDGGTISIRYWGDTEWRLGLATATVGEDGIEPDVPYCVRDGKLVRA